MKQRGGSARTGDVIPYVFCLSEGEESAKTAQADRAKHPDEIRKSSELAIGKIHDDSLLSMYRIYSQIMTTIYQIKFCLQLNACASLSRERIDPVWLNVLVRVYTLQKLEA